MLDIEKLKTLTAWYGVHRSEYPRSPVCEILSLQEAIDITRGKSLLVMIADPGV